jgi:hypothetical protein
MSIVIKRRVSLEFLGEDYKDSYLVFKSIALREYDALQIAAKEVEKDETKSISFIQEQLLTRFIEGKIDNQTVTPDDLLDLPVDVILECFNQIRGNLSPKD